MVGLNRCPPVVLSGLPLSDYMPDKHALGARSPECDMYCPLVGERVWVRGSPHEFIVVRADYSASIATISPVVDKSQLKRCPFRELFSYDDFEGAQTRQYVKEALVDFVGSSRIIAQNSRMAIEDMRQTTITTGATIKKSKDLIDQTDRIIARWKSLGCNE